MEVNIHHFHRHWQRWIIVLVYTTQAEQLADQNIILCKKRGRKSWKSLAPVARRWIVLANHLRVNQSERAIKALFTCVVYTKQQYCTVENLFAVQVGTHTQNCHTPPLSSIHSDDYSSWIINLLLDILVVILLSGIHTVHLVRCFRL